MADFDDQVATADYFPHRKAGCKAYDNDNKEDKDMAEQDPAKLLATAMQQSALALQAMTKALQVHAQIIDQHSDVIDDHEHRIANLENVLGE